MMNNSVRYLLLFLIISHTLFNANAQSNKGYKIEVQIKQFEDTIAYLGYHFGDKKYIQDTSKVSRDGKMLFEGNRDLATGVYFVYSKTFYLELIVDEARYSISTNRSNLYDNMIIKNSPSNEFFRDFQKIMIEHQKKVHELTGSLDSTSSRSDSLKIYEEIRLVNDNNQLKRDELLAKTGDNYVIQILKMMDLKAELRFEDESFSTEQKVEKYNKFRKNYFDGLNFSSSGLLRSPIFHSKLIEFVDKITIQNPDSVIVSIDELLAKSKDNEELYRYIIGVMFQKYQNPTIMGMDKIFVHLSDEYYLKGKAPWTDDAMMKKLKEELIFHRENQLGMKAPQIFLIDTLNKNVDLYSVKANYIILFFYSPTCGHCKKKAPELRDLYHKMNGKAEVVAVSTDTDIDVWKDFIKDLKLDWINYADPNSKSNFRVQYNVRSTPVIYVLNKDKVIIGKKLAVEQLEQFIDDQLRMEGLKIN